MAASIGRNLTIKKGATVLAGVNAKTISIGGEPVDITSDDDAGFRTLLDTAGTMSLDLSVEGVTKDTVLRAAIMAGASSLLLTDITINYDNGDVISGDFFLASFEESGAHNDALKFSCSLQSSEAWIYTPSV